MIENPFSPYKDIHQGETAILFGSGPSILNFDSKKISSDVLQFGINDQIFLDLDLDYWFMGDSHRQDSNYFFNKYSLYNDYKPKEQKFIRYCNWAHQEFITLGNKQVNRNGQLPLNMKYSKYYVADSAGNPDQCLFNADLGIGNLQAVSSITFEILQFVLYSGIEKLFLVGHDCDYTTGDYNGSNIGKNLNAGHWISKYWEVCAPWIAQNYPKLQIYWVEPKGLQMFTPMTLEAAYEMMN
tara:strand:- start:1748 stop:2467 length:720 start_codon:yes stop_codon:yes gene_type:complete